MVPQELEDLVPLSIAASAARAYVAHVIGIDADEAGRPSVGDIRAQLGVSPGPLGNAVLAAVRECFEGKVHIEKVGFAREMVTVADQIKSDGRLKDGGAVLAGNFGTVLSHLARLLRTAVQQEDERRSSNRLKRAVQKFLDDHPTGATHEAGRLVLESVEESLDESSESDSLRVDIRRIRRDFGLDESPVERIKAFEQFRERVQGLAYAERLSLQAASDAVPTTQDYRAPSICATSFNRDEAKAQSIRK